MAYTRQPNVVLAGTALKQNPSASTVAPAGIIPVVLDADIASKTQLGVVKIGNGISVTEDGLISVKRDDDDKDCILKTTLVKESYNVSPDDCYVGVNAEKATTITLPKKPSDGKVVIVKAEMKPPLGNRKVTITTADGTLIDGYENCIIQVSNETVRLVFRDGWRII
jgi:hypothetical protein